LPAHGLSRIANDSRKTLATPAERPKHFRDDFAEGVWFSRRWPAQGWRGSNWVVAKSLVPRFSFPFMWMLLSWCTWAGLGRACSGHGAPFSPMLRLQFFDQSEKQAGFCYSSPLITKDLAEFLKRAVKAFSYEHSAPVKGCTEFAIQGSQSWPYHGGSND